MTGIESRQASAQGDAAATIVFQPLHLLPESLGTGANAIIGVHAGFRVFGNAVIHQYWEGATEVRSPGAKDSSARQGVTKRPNQVQRDKAVEAHSGQADS